MTPDELLTKFKKWFDSGGFKEILLDVRDSEPDPWYETAVIHKLTFRSKRKDQLAFEVWIGSEGELGFGIHEYGYLDFKLAPWINEIVFVGGREPAYRKIELTLKILELVSQGRVRICLTMLPLVGVVDARIVFPKDHLEELGSLGLKIGNSETRTMNWVLPFQKMIHFEPWT